jgi:hypothetical protein
MSDPTQARESALFPERGERHLQETLRFSLLIDHIAERELLLSSYARGLHGLISLAPTGGVRLRDEESAAQLERLADDLVELIPEEAKEAIEERSEMTWLAFVGHCVVWWISQRGSKDILLTFAAGAAAHQVILNLKWNEGRRVRPLPLPPPYWPVITWGISGLLIGQLVWWAPWPLTLALGLIVGWSIRKSRWVCGGLHCGAELSGPRGDCAQCGGTLDFKRRPGHPAGSL